MKKVYINGRFLTQNITGVQRCAVEFTKVLDRYLDDETFKNKYKIELLAPHNIKQKMELKNISIKKIGILKGHLWEQFELPFYAKDGFLFNFCNCAPLIKTNQVVTIHDTAVVSVPDAYSLPFKLWYKFMFRILGFRLNNIFTDSYFSKRELNKHFNIREDKISVIYCGINHILKIKPDESIFDKFNINKGNYVLGVSSLNPAKNFQLILKAAQKLPDFNFVIAGGNNSSVFNSRGLEIPNNVKFIGYVSDEELVALYKYAYCFVFPSLYEGFGIPPLEAMSFGCPAILSNIDVLKEIAQDSVLYCDTENPEVLANQIRKKDTLVNLRGSNKQKAILSKYTWEKAVKQMLDKVI